MANRQSRSSALAGALLTKRHAGHLPHKGSLGLPVIRRESLSVKGTSGDLFSGRERRPGHSRKLVWQLRGAGNRQHQYAGLNPCFQTGFHRGRQFPICHFLLYNLVMSVGQPTNLNKCCVLGFHGATGTPIQTYSPIDFDSTGLFGPTVHDTSIAAHEVGEWMDDRSGTILHLPGGTPARLADAKTISKWVILCRALTSHPSKAPTDSRIICRS